MNRIGNVAKILNPKMKNEHCVEPNGMNTNFYSNSTCRDSPVVRALASQPPGVVLILDSSVTR